MTYNQYKQAFAQVETTDEAMRLFGRAADELHAVALTLLVDAVADGGDHDYPLAARQIASEIQSVAYEKH